MKRPLRCLVVALLSVILAAAWPLPTNAATSSRTPPRPDRSLPDFTRAEVRDLLAQAKQQVRRDGRRAPRGEPLRRGSSTDLTLTLRDLALARPTLTGQQRREANALLARPSDPDGDDVEGEVSYDGQTKRRYCPAGGVACIHYVLTGGERVAATDTDQDKVPDYVETVYAAVKQVWASEVTRMGYQRPLPDGGSSGQVGNPDDRLDVFLADLGGRGVYGYCAPEGEERARQQSGYCVLDNNYSRAEFGISPTYALKATAAHEFFHAIQFGYDAAEDPWFMEGSAAWMEDEVYDAINDNYQYLSTSKIRMPRSPVDYSRGMNRYGAWLFFRYASERLGRDVVRRMWQTASAGNGNAYSLQAFESTVSTRTAWPAFVALFNAWNTLPAGSYQERGGYPSPVYTRNQTLTATRRTTNDVRVNLPHLSSSSIRLAPGAKLSTASRLAIGINAPNRSHGSTALVQTRYRDGHVTHRTAPLNAAGNATVRIAFNRRSISSVVLVVSNTSTAMRVCGTVNDQDGTIYSCGGRGLYDSGQTFTVRAHLG